MIFFYIEYLRNDTR